MTKGWIDRVWNLGWAYGGTKVPLTRARMLAICSSSAEHYAKRGYDSVMRTQLETGIMDYCGIRDCRIEFLHGSLDDDPTRERLLQAALQLGREF